MKSRKILIAEDELLIAKVLRLQLEKEGFIVENIVDADQAVILAKHFKPDIIILDVFLKNNTSGIDAGIRIRTDGHTCPIIFTTGNSYQSTLKETHQISNSNVMIKPVEFDALLKLINKSH